MFIFKMITNNNLFLVIGAVAIFFPTLSTCTSAACNKHDRKALLAFKDSFVDNPFYTSSPDWMSNSTKDCCSWDYVQCDSKGRVTSFSVSGDNFDYPPPALLNGLLPDVLGNLTALEELSFFDMPDLVGPIPPELSKLKRLNKLEFNRCGLSGPIPSFLSQMPALEVIDFSNNMFTGPIPHQLSKLKRLRSLAFESCSLSGPVPSFISQMHALEAIDLQNMLTGTIPPSLGNLENLNSLRLFSNQLTGTIPSTLFSRAKKGNIFLYLSSNKLTGTIPRSFANVDFGNFYVDNNRLTGDASFLLGKNKKMDGLGLRYNKFAFDLTKVEYPATLTSLTLSNNKIYGSISNQITELPNLSIFDVRNNRLCGKIPSGGSFEKFIAFYFAHNKCLCGTPLPPCK